MVRFAERRVFQSRHGALCSKTRRDFVQRAEKWESRKNKGQLIHKGGRHEGCGKQASGSCPHGMPSALLKMCKVGKLMLVLVMMANCDYAAGLSASQIMSSVPVHAFLGGSNFKNRQHLYFVNVSALVDDNPNLPNFMAPQRLSVKLEQDGPTYGRLRPLVLSLCHEQLPCGDLGCSCPAKFVDDGSRGLSAGDSLNSVRSVDVNPCDLNSGIWYVSVDFANGKMGVGAAMDEPSVGYTLTAMLQSALIRAGEASEDVLCCMQSQYFVLLVTQLMKGNELRIKLLSDDRLHNQSPLRLSMSYEGCVDARTETVRDARMGQVVVLPPEQVRRGPLYLGVHTVDRGSARFLLSVSYRPELKWTVVAFLISMLVVVLVTLCGVCLVRMRRKMSKLKHFSDEVKLRKKALKMTVRGSEEGSKRGSENGSISGGRVNLSDSDDSAEDQPLNTNSIL